jgi:TolB-like protein/DNA-binding winged helix-turn-helix (wHTH) protein
MNDDTDLGLGSKDEPQSRPNVMNLETQFYEFGPFRLEPAERKLLRGNEAIALTPKAFDTLLLLVRNSGHLMEKDKLLNTLWPDSFVEEGSLSNNIFVLRKALGGDLTLIETVPGRGYRFVGAVRQVPFVTSPAQVGNSAGFNRDVASKFSPERRLWFMAAVLLGIVGLLVTLSLRNLRKRMLGRGSQGIVHSLAVLPMVDLSSDAHQDYFADGMTEELTTNLGKIGALRVVSRTSVMHYKDSKKPLSEIARELNVDAVIEGTVARSGSHLRMTANLIQVSPEKHLWAESYESELGNARTVQGEIVQAVAREIGVKLTQKEQALLTGARLVNAEAQDLYLRGRYVAQASPSADSTEKAIEYFEQAIQKDSNYAPAYFGLASVYSSWIPGMRSPRDLMPKAKEFAVKALQLDDTLADAHSTLGFIELFYYWDWSVAEEEFKRTMELNPNHIGAHEWHSRGLVTRGQTEKAIAEAKLSLALSPSPLSWDYPIWVFFLARRYDLALERAQELTRLAPNYVWGHLELGKIYGQRGQTEEAAQESLKVDELFGTDPTKMAQLKEAIARSGAQGYWSRTIENYKKAAKSTYVPPVLVAEACVRVGDEACVFEWLEKGFEERDDLMINLNVEPLFDGLRSDPRFKDLVHRVGIPR